MPESLPMTLLVVLWRCTNQIKDHNTQNRCNLILIEIYHIFEAMKHCIKFESKLYSISFIWTLYAIWGLGTHVNRYITTVERTITNTKKLLTRNVKWYFGTREVEYLSLLYRAPKSHSTLYSPHRLYIFSRMERNLTVKLDWKVHFTVEFAWEVCKIHCPAIS